MRRAELLGYVPAGSTTGSVTTKQLLNFRGNQTPVVRGALPQAQEALGKLAVVTEEWQRQARRDGATRRGRKTGNRVFFGEWIAIKLAAAGISLSKSPDGRLARVLTVTYDAAGIRAPVDLFRDTSRILGSHDVWTAAQRHATTQNRSRKRSD